MKDDKTTHELKSAEDLHRFEASMMVGQTAVYLLVNGALLNAVAGKDVSDFNRISIAIFGIVLSLGYLLISHRTGVNLRGARKRRGVVRRAWFQALLIRVQGSQKQDSCEQERNEVYLYRRWRLLDSDFTEDPMWIMTCNRNEAKSSREPTDAI